MEPMLDGDFLAKHSQHPDTLETKLKPLKAQAVCKKSLSNLYYLWERQQLGTLWKDQNVLSPVNCWNLLLNPVKQESQDHTTLSDIYLNNIIPCFVQVSEDSGRLFKKQSGNQLETNTKITSEYYPLMHVVPSTAQKLELRYDIDVVLDDTRQERAESVFIDMQMFPWFTSLSQAKAVFEELRDLRMAIVIP
ncbi:hypothetical protein Q9233_003982 [Columba guinea]|nr:hypothetical protein Q9233_003982 [Columba guinea]